MVTLDELFNHRKRSIKSKVFDRVNNEVHLPVIGRVEFAIRPRTLAGAKLWDDVPRRIVNNLRRVWWRVS